MYINYIPICDFYLEALELVHVLDYLFKSVINELHGFTMISGGN